MKLKVLVVDDLQAMRILVLEYLRRIDTVIVVGEASNAEEALQKVNEHHPDVVLLDISLAGASGVDVAKQMKTFLPKVRIYLFSAYEVDEFRDLEMNSPADGFIQKSNLKPELLEMIQKEVGRKKESED